MPKKNKNVNVKPSKLIENISLNNMVIVYLKKFFYQIIGIYIPSLVLILYVLLFYLQILLPKSDISNLVYEIYHSGIMPQPFFDILLFITSIIIVGEGINALTTRIIPLSPIRRKSSSWEYAREVFAFVSPRNLITGNLTTGITKKVGWPLWLNDTEFPISFSNFDRYYIALLEQEKKNISRKDRLDFFL